MRFPSIQSALNQRLKEDPFWHNQFSAKGLSASGATVHLAILVEPYLQFILDGEKTIETRFSVNRIAPYQRVRNGDILILKKAAGEAFGIAMVENAWFYQINPKTFSEIRKLFGAGICGQGEEFWKARQKANYASLMLLSNVKRISPLKIDKTDRRGWVILHQSTQPELLESS